MRAGLLALPLLLAACSGGGQQDRVTSADEDRQLNEAAEMLDANSVELDATTNTGTP